MVLFLFVVVCMFKMIEFVIEMIIEVFVFVLELEEDFSFCFKFCDVLSLDDVEINYVFYCDFLWAGDWD